MDTADKYVDKVSQQHVTEMALVVQAYQLIKLAEPHLRTIDEDEIRSHSFMHITNPTLYKDMINSKKFAAQMNVIRAARQFLAVCEQCLSDFQGGAG
jgi:hypothetical protein